MAYFDKDIETAPRERLREIQLSRLQKSVTQALKIPFYRDRLNENGISSGEQIKDLSDIRKIPFTTKDDLRASFPEGLLAVSKDEVVRLHTSSGTTGTPTVICHTKNDLNAWAGLVARSMVASGATKSDVFQNMTGYGMFTGGLGMHYGAELVGMTILPMGSGNTRRQLEYMKYFKTTIVHATPSYMLHIATKLEEAQISLSDLCLKKGFLGAEPYSENTRIKIENLFKIDVYNSYGLSEMNGPGVAFECEYKNGMHLWEDAFYLEIIDPETGEPVAEGNSGELVFTTLMREATPLLRYRCRDIASILAGECPCGRTHRRISRITGRADDMLIVNGVNIFPGQIESVIMRHPEVGTNYQILLENKGELEKLTVNIEISAAAFSGDIHSLDRLKAELAEDIKGAVIVRPEVKLHEPGSLPVTEGKAVRVIDNRIRI